MSAQGRRNRLTAETGPGAAGALAGHDPGRPPAASRYGRLLALGLAALTGAVLLGGCGPLPTVTASNPAVAFEGGSCTLTVNATDLTPSTTWQIGMYTTGSPVMVGNLTSDSSGSIVNGIVTYPSTTLPRKYSNLFIEVYTTQGAGIASAQLTTAACLPTGLAP